MYTFFIPFLFIFISHVIGRSEYRRSRSYEPKIFSTCIEHLGCVDTNEKWYDKQYRPLNLEPLERHTIRTEFLLMKASTNGSKDILYDILTLKVKTVEISGFKTKKKTFFLIHDFTSNGHTGWIKHIAIAITEELDANIVTVDWEAGAEPPFEQAISNARIVGLETEAFIKMITSKFGIDPGEIHIIGHGVGAHIAGYVGKSVKGIGRITALDPTGPRFENMPSIVRLDPDDAKYVEVLHTEAFNHRSQGTLQPMGHSDFYLNNAAHQPGCNETSGMTKFTDITRSELREGKILPACSHKRAFKYYISAITTRECKFVGIACNSYESFINGSCSDCDNSICATFDMCPPPKNVYKTRFFLNTHSEAPFCMHGYQVNISIESNENSKKADGYFEFILTDVNNKITFSAGSEFGNTRRTYIPGVTYTLIIYAPPPAITDMKEAKVRWRSVVVFPFPKKSIYVKYISVKRIPMMGESVPVIGMCPESGTTEIRDSAYIQFVTCNVARIQEEQRIAALTTLAVKLTTMASTTTTASTAVINVTWTLANATTTTPKPPIQCLTPGPSGGEAVPAQTAATTISSAKTVPLVPTKTPIPGHTEPSIANLGGAAAMLSNISMNGSLGTVQTICYTINVPDNVTLKPEELTNLVFFDKHTNKTTIPTTPITTGLSTTVTHPPPEEELTEEQAEKEKQTEIPPETSAIQVAVLTSTISEEMLEGFQTEVTATATTPIEEIENEAVITSVSTAAQMVFSTTMSQGIGSTVGTGVETSVSNLSVSSLSLSLSVSSSTEHEQTLASTHEVIESTSIRISTFPAEHVETTSEAIEAITSSSIPRATSEAIEAITSSSIPITTSEAIEAITSSSIPIATSEAIEAITSSSIPIATSEAIEAITSSSIPIATSEAIEAITSSSIPITTSEAIEAITSSSIPIVTSEAIEAITSSSIPITTSEAIEAITSSSIPMTTSEAKEAITSSSIPITTEELEITTISNIPTMAEEVEVTTISNIPTMVGEVEVTTISNIPSVVETTYEIIHTTAASNVSVSVTEIVVNETTSIHVETTTMPFTNPTEAHIEETSLVKESTVEELQSSTFIAEVTEIVNIIENVTAEQGLTEAAEVPYNSEVTEGVIETSSETTASSNIPMQETSPKVVEGQFGGSQVEGGPEKETSKSFTLSEAITERIVSTEVLTPAQMNETSTCTEWNVTELVTEVEKEEFTYVMRFTEEEGFISAQAEEQQSLQVAEQTLPTTVMAQEKPSLEITETTSASPPIEITPLEESKTEEIKLTSTIPYVLTEETVESEQHGNETEFTSEKVQGRTSEGRVTYLVHFTEETEFVSSEAQEQQISTTEEQVHHTKHQQHVGEGGKMGFLSGQIVSHNGTYEEIIKEEESSVQGTSATVGMGVETSVISSPSTHEVESSVLTAIVSTSTTHTEATATLKTTTETTTMRSSTTIEITTTTPKTTESTTTMTPITTTKSTTITSSSTTTESTTATPSATTTHRTSRKTTTRPKTKTTTTSKRTTTRKTEHEKQKETEPTTECTTEELPECDEIEE